MPAGSKDEIKPSAEGTCSWKKEGPAALWGLHQQIAFGEEVPNVHDRLKLAREDIWGGKRLQQDYVQVRITPAKALVIRIGGHDRLAWNPAIGSDHAGVDSWNPR